MNEFRDSAPAAETVFLRTYSRRKEDGTRENFEEAMLRTVDDIAEIGQLDQDEYALIREQALEQHSFPSGRAFWVAGTEWSKKQENFSGYYNCTSTHIVDIESFGNLVDLAMQGSGTGAVLEQESISKLPPILNYIDIKEFIPIGEKGGSDLTVTRFSENGDVTLVVGDSRAGWVSAYVTLIELATSNDFSENSSINLKIDLSNVRPSGEPLKGFGGTANPIKLQSMFSKVAALLNGAVGRQLTSVEACLLIDEAATAVVAGNIRRSAGMRQFGQDDEEAATSKLGLYKQDENGNWSIDPKREALVMANHTRCFHTKPSYQEIEDAVAMQFNSGEGAIQYVPEAVARANVDILNTAGLKKQFIDTYVTSGRDKAKSFLYSLSLSVDKPLGDKELSHRMDRYGLNPCGEIIGRDFHCNLSEVHLNTLDPGDYEAQADAFYAAGLQVAALLQHKFAQERYQYSREIDPIVGVSFTGLFDFFVHAGGQPWLEWMMGGRKNGRARDAFEAMERNFLHRWRRHAHLGVRHYCSKHNVRIPNRITTVQPAGTKSLLTGASSGWHPPKSQRFIRRITLGIKDPLVASLFDYGYNIIPAQSAKDENGNLLDDVLDPRVQEVLVEIPTEVSWANIPGCDEFDLNQLPVESQWGLYMQVQNSYTDHNTSATIEIRQNEIPILAELIHQNIEKYGGYISAALLARFDSNETFPRLPFEPITKDQYEKMKKNQQKKRVSDETLLEILEQYDSSDWTIESVAGCTNEACIAKADAAEREGKL
jgi:ribonucleotide reductase, class II